MTLVATITDNQLWTKALEQSTLPIITTFDQAKDITKSACIQSVLKMKDIEALLSHTESLIVAYVQPENMIADLLEEGLSLSSALTAWKEQTEALTSLYTQHRRSLSLVNLDHLKDISTEGFKTLASLGWPLNKSVNNVPERLTAIALRHEIVKDHQNSRLNTLLEASTYQLSQHTEAFNSLELEQALESHKSNLAARQADSDLSTRLTEEAQIKSAAIAQMMSAQEELEDYYLKIQDVQREKSEQRKELDRLKQAHSANNGEIASLKYQLTQSEKRLDAIHKSIFWKTAAPVRAFSKLISRDTAEKARFNEEKQMLLESEYFDAHWYLEFYADVKEANLDAAEHFLKYGGIEKRRPSEKFDTEWYLQTYPDVETSGLNPLIHFLHFGRHENRAPLPTFPADQNSN